jgi:hypothetical protein
VTVGLQTLYTFVNELRQVLDCSRAASWLASATEPEGNGFRRKCSHGIIPEARLAAQNMVLWWRRLQARGSWTVLQAHVAGRIFYNSVSVVVLRQRTHSHWLFPQFDIRARGIATHSALL